MNGIKNVNLISSNKDAVMKRFSIALTCLAATLAVVGCNEAGPDIDRVQTSLVDKNVFEGEWYYGQTVIHVDGDEAATLGTYEGEQPWGDRGIDGSDYGLSPSMPRIRWVIDEDYLFAYRAYELQDGGNNDGDDPNFRGQPLAVFPITRHVDLRQDYNPVTGERSNVRVENSSDRRWYERTHMYVDWSQNMISSFNGVMDATYAALYYQRESAPFFFEENGHDSFPASWAPQFVRIGEDREGFRWADEWPSDMDGTVHYMSFVTQELYSPGANCLYVGGGACQTVGLTIRHAFLRVPPNHEYAVETQTHREFDEFGLFRTHGRTFIRGNRPVEETARACETVADCGVSGGDCVDGICVGGLARNYGDTDFLNFFRPRFNFWADSLQEDTSCVADHQCPDAGSQCDLAAGQCTVPYEERPIRRVAYHLNPGYPKHLVRVSFQTIGDWNEAFMRGQRAVKGTPLPTGPDIACQDSDPTAYCYCGSPEAMGGSCKWQYDPFQSPDDATAAGVENAYDCYIEGPAKVENPTSYDDYDDVESYQYEFVGEECMLVLESNSCDKDPEAACEELGDIRYQFFNYIPHGGLRFGGVAAPLVDPTTGELITSNANMAGTSIEAVGTYALEFFPALRCSSELGCGPNDEENADLKYTTGENVRDYFANTGNTVRPVTVQPSGTDGFSLPDDGPRPALPAEGLLEHFNAQFEQVLPRIEALQGTEGRAQIMSDRMKRLEGTSVESRLLASMGSDGREALLNTQDLNFIGPHVSIDDDQVKNQISPMRHGTTMLDLMPNELAQWRHLSNYNIDPPFEVRNMQQRQRYFEYWAEAFRGAEPATASIRMQQMYLKAVMRHEVGHCVGLRHNFGSSFDRNNWYDGALNVLFDNPMPTLSEYDTPDLGGDADGSVNGEEINNYYADVRRIRNLRADSGMYNYTSGSVMEYAGDLSDLNDGLGRYDIAATVWNHFGMKEAFVGDPRHRSDDTLDGALRSHEHARTWWKAYRGGESCTVDDQCPYSSSGSVASGQPVTQRCIQNPRVSRLPRPCGGMDNCVCSSFEEDFLDFADGVAYEWDTDGDDKPDYYPVPYLFCSDVRVSDVSWCNRFDSGESFQETIDHFRRSWEEVYPRAYYRRFRRTSLSGGAAIGSIIDAAKIYQHLFFRYFYEPGFRSDEGPLGFLDQYFASIDAMHWLTELVNLPSSGSYEYDATNDIYRHLGEEMDMAGSDMALPIGTGYPVWSEYQDGYSGFFRMERAGTFWDKFYALYALAIRDWGLSFTIDERFSINFYDLFPVEMTEFFGGIMIDDPAWYAPRVEMVDGEPRLQNMSLFRDAYACTVDGRRTVCRGPQSEVYPGSVVGDTVNPILRDWGTMLALAQFPVFYDTSFEQRVQIFKLSSGEGWDIPAVQPDGSPTCAYGDFAVDPAHDTGCTAEDADYVVFDSVRFHTPYIAVKVRSRLEFNLEEEQIGFYMLQKAVELQEEVETLRAITDPTDAELAELYAKEDQLHKTESFLEYLIDLQRRYGISSYL